MTKRQTLGVALVALAAAVLGGLVSQAVASPPFSDIGTSPFEEEIINIANAGIATGFPDGTFRPRDPVNRQQFAAWMNRGGGRVSTDAFGIGPFAGTDPAVVFTGGEISAGAAGGVGGFVMVTANVAVVTSNPANCPCRIDIDLVSDEGNVMEGGPGATAVSFDLPGPNPQTGQSRMTASLTRVFRLPALSTDRYDLGFDVVDANVTAVTGVARITSLYVPFNGAGGSS
jgi:S-layer homology domain